MSRFSPILGWRDCSTIDSSARGRAWVLRRALAIQHVLVQNDESASKIAQQNDESASKVAQQSDDSASKIAQQ